MEVMEVAVKVEAVKVMEVVSVVVRPRRSWQEERPKRRVFRHKLDQTEGLHILEWCEHCLESLQTRILSIASDQP